MITNLFIDLCTPLDGGIGVKSEHKSPPSETKVIQLDESGRVTGLQFKNSSGVYKLVSNSFCAICYYVMPKTGSLNVVMTSSTTSGYGDIFRVNSIDSIQVDAILNNRIAGTFTGSTSPRESVIDVEEGQIICFSIHMSRITVKATLTYEE